MPAPDPPTRSASPAGSGSGLPSFLLTASPLAASLLAGLAAPGAGARQSSRLLENETRRDVYERVVDHPGTTIADAADAAGVSHSTATYHLDRLADAGIVVALEDGNKVRYFPNAGAYDRDERRCLAILENPTTRDVLAAIADLEPTYRAEVADALGVSTPTVNWHLERLGDCRLLADGAAGDRRTLEVDRDRATLLLDSLAGKLDDTNVDAIPIRDLAAALGD